MKKASHKKQIWLLILALFLLLAAGCLFLAFQEPAKTELQLLDYQQIASTEYDTVFFSMYPVDTYREEDYAYFRGMTLFKSSYCIPSLSVLTDYMLQIADSGNHVTTAYLGIRPDLTSPEKLRKLLEQYPDITFEIVLPYPSADYWQALSQEDYEQTLAAYCSFLTAAPEIQEANFYFFGAYEWLIANPANYLDQWSVNEEIARTLMAYSDRDHGSLITTENAAVYAETLTSLTRSLRTAPQTYPDMSGYCIVFFGDSVIGNYTDSTSIPEVVSGLTDAEVYNCARGGDCSLLGPTFVNAFFQEDLSEVPEDSQAYAGITSYLANRPTDKQLCFVINYGLNDYFYGLPAISAEDPDDVYASYHGAMQTTVKLIKDNAPDAQIIVCTPNFSAAFENGMDPRGANDNILEDYAETLMSLAEKLGIDVLDNYHNLGITPENQGQYLADQVHPNEACRFQIASELAKLLRP